MTLILILGLTPPALVGVNTEAEPGSFDPGAGETLVLTFGTDGVDGAAIADPPGRGFLSPPIGRGFLIGLATILSPCPPAGEDSLSVGMDGRAVLPDGGGDMDLPKIKARRLGFAALSVTMRLLRGRPSGVADFGVDRCPSIFGRFGAGGAFSSFSGRGRLGAGNDDGESAAFTDFGTLMMLGFRDRTGGIAVTVPPSADAGVGFATLEAGVLILMEGAR